MRWIIRLAIIITIVNSNLLIHIDIAGQFIAIIGEFFQICNQNMEKVRTIINVVIKNTYVSLEFSANELSKDVWLIGDVVYNGNKT